MVWRGERKPGNLDETHSDRRRTFEIPQRLWTELRIEFEDSGAWGGNDTHYTLPNTPWQKPSVWFRSSESLEIAYEENLTSDEISDVAVCVCAIQILQI